MQVTKLIEGGYDLISGTQIEVGMVVSNGKRELMIPVDEKTLGLLIKMHMEVVKVGEVTVTTPSLNSPDTPRLTAIDMPPATPPENFQFQIAGSEEIEEAEDEEGFMAGEEYEDSGTGVSSL